jgi:hypothetical protein
MIGILDAIREGFPLYFRMIFAAPSFLIQEWRGIGLVTLTVSLILAIAITFLCNRWVQKQNLEFIPGVILTALALTLTVGVVGLVMSLSSLANALYPFIIVGFGSPVLNIVLGALVVSAGRLKARSPKAGTILLGGVALLFAWALAATPIIFFYALYNY